MRRPCPGCWQQMRNTWAVTPVNFCTLNQSSSSESKEFLDLIGKQIKSSCLVEVTEGVCAPSCLVLQQAKCWSFDALTMQRACSPCFGDLRITLPCVTYNRPELRFQEVPQGQFTQFPMSRQMCCRKQVYHLFAKLSDWRPASISILRKLPAYIQEGESAYAAIILIHRNKTNQQCPVYHQLREINIATQGWLTCKVCPVFPQCYKE